MIIFEFSEYNLLTLATHKLKKVIAAHEASNQDSLSKTSKKDLKARLKFRHMTSIGSSHLFLASEKDIYLLNLDGTALTLKIKLHHTSITSFAANQQKSVLCVGDSNGRLTYYNNVLSNFDQQNIFHWHSAKVAALDFANLGEMVLTGGLEGVIVVWYFGGAKKDFCPRVDGEIVEIVSNLDGDKVC